MPEARGGARPRYDAVLFDLLTALLDSWTLWDTDELQPWPEAPSVVGRLAGEVPLGVVTNCSTALGHGAAERLGVRWDVVVTAEEAGAYKPRLEPYRLALGSLSLPADRVLFVAGSRFDLPGATGVGLPVWWHNRMHMERGTSPAPIAEHDTLEPLIRHVVADGQD